MNGVIKNYLVFEMLITVLSGVKGGVGKTTIALLITATSILHGQSVLYIDISGYLLDVFNVCKIKFKGSKPRDLVDYLNGKCSSFRQVIAYIGNFVYTYVKNVEKIPVLRFAKFLKIVKENLPEINVIIDNPANIPDKLLKIYRICDIAIVVSESTKESLAYANEIIEKLKLMNINAIHIVNKVIDSTCNSICIRRIEVKPKDQSIPMVLTKRLIQCLASGKCEDLREIIHALTNGEEFTILQNFQP